MENPLFRIKKIRTQIYLFLPVAFILIAWILIGIGQFESPLLSQFRMALIETVTPVVRVVSAPFRWGKDALEFSGDFINAYQENKRLKLENAELKNWQLQALKMDVEQKKLKELLNYIPPPKTTFVTAEVLSDNGSRFSRSLIVSAGRDQGVLKGDLAMTPAGVLGRIVEVGKNMSRLMLLTDYASRIPVRVGENQILGILTGDGSTRPKVISLPADKTVSVGDVVFSSGQMGVYPTGLGIGVVESINDGDIKVRLFEEDRNPTLVRLVNFGLNSVLLSDTCPSEGSE